MIDSYRLALGDFEIAGNFQENTDYIICFWIIFFVGTLISLLVILNMVIAVMGTAFEKVSEDTEAHIYRTRLNAMLKTFYIFPTSLRKEMKKNKYLVSIEVDPSCDPIEK